jgi:hypothetical protein
MATECLIDDLGRAQGSAGARRQPQLEPVRPAECDAIGWSRQESSDRNPAHGEMLLTIRDASPKTTDAPGRRLLQRLTRQPTTQGIVSRRCGIGRGGTAGESTKPDVSPVYPTHFLLTAEQPEASIADFENAQRHDPGIESGE